VLCFFPDKNRYEIMEKREDNMQDAINILMVGIMVLLGGIPSIYILVSMPVILAGKIYRKVRFGNSLYD